MAYQFSCGFDDIITASQKWDLINGSPAISSGAARFGSLHSQGITFSANTAVGKNLVGNPGTVIVSFAIQMISFPTTSPGIILQLFDGATVQCSMAVSNTGVLTGWQGARGTLRLTCSTNITTGVWHYLEFKVAIATSGSITIQMDGSQIGTVSGVQTRQTANSQATFVQYGDPENRVANWKSDDFICLDGTGAALNDFLGDKRITTLMPNGAGSFTQLIPNGAASNWDCVNEIPPNDNTDYVASATLNDRDSYVFDQISGLNGNADFIVPWGRVGRDDGSSHTIELSATDTGNDAFSSALTVPASYSYVNGGAFTSSPNGGAAWSQAVINRTEWGIKLIS